MKKCGRMIWLTLLVLGVTVFMFTSCKNGIQDLLEELDASLGAQKTINPLPGDENFKPSEMLAEKYLVSRDAMLCLSAPKASTYNWQIFRMYYTVDKVDVYEFEYVEYEEVVIDGKIPVTNKNLILYMPEVKEILPSGTYKLLLTVTDDMGKAYTDTAALVIYDPFHDY